MAMPGAVLAWRLANESRRPPFPNSLNLAAVVVYQTPYLIVSHKIQFRFNEIIAR